MFPNLPDENCYFKPWTDKAHHALMLAHQRVEEECSDLSSAHFWDSVHIQWIRIYHDIGGHRGQDIALCATLLGRHWVMMTQEERVARGIQSRQYFVDRLIWERMENSKDMP